MNGVVGSRSDGACFWLEWATAPSVLNAKFNMTGNQAHNPSKLFGDRIQRP